MPKTMETSKPTMERYRQLRAIQVSLNGQITRTLPKRAFEETAKKLGMWRGGRIVFEKEDDTGMFSDSVLYDYLADGKNAVVRFAARHDGTGDERAVLDAMLRAWPTVVEVRERFPDRGARIVDVITGEEQVLSDDGLAVSADVGMCLVTRLLVIDGIVMTSGAPGLVPPAVADMLRLAAGLDARRWTWRQRAAVGSLLCRVVLSTGTEDMKNALTGFILHGSGPLADALREAVGEQGSVRRQDDTAQS